MHLRIGYSRNKEKHNSRSKRRYSLLHGSFRVAFLASNRFHAIKFSQRTSKIVVSIFLKNTIYRKMETFRSFYKVILKLVFFLSSYYSQSLLKTLLCVRSRYSKFRLPSINFTIIFFKSQISSLNFHFWI